MLVCSARWLCKKHLRLCQSQPHDTWIFYEKMLACSDRAGGPTKGLWGHLGVLSGPLGPSRSHLGPDWGHLGSIVLSVLEATFKRPPRDRARSLSPGSRTLLPVVRLLTGAEFSAGPVSRPRALEQRFWPHWSTEDPPGSLKEAVLHLYRVRRF